MTTLQITSLEQVKKLLDYGGHFIVTDTTDNFMYLIHYDIERHVVMTGLDVENKTTYPATYGRGFPENITFHSWVVSPPLKEGEEVFDCGYNEKGTIACLNYSTYTMYGSDVEFNSHYAVPCRLLEEEKEEEIINKEYERGHIDGLCHARDMVARAFEDAIDKLTILSKKNNQ